MSPAATESSIRPELERQVDLQVFTAMAMVGFYVAAMGAVLAVLAEEFAVSAESLSWVGSTFGAGLLIAAASGRFLLRRGPRPALVGGSLALGVGSLGVAFAPQLPVVFASAVLQGLGAAVLVLVAPVMVRHNADVRLTRANAVASLVGIAAPVLVGAIMATGASGRLALQLLVPITAWLIWTLRQPGQDSETSAPVVPVPDGGGPRPSLVFRRWLTVVMAVSVEFCFVVWGVTKLRDAGVDTSLAALGGIAFPVGMTVGRLSGRWLIRHVPAVPFGAAVAALGTLLAAFGSQPAVVAVGLLVAGIGVATLYPVTLANLMAVPGLRPSSGASFGALASGTAILFAPTALASLAGVIDLQLAFLIPLPMLALLLVLHGRTHRR